MNYIVMAKQAVASAGVPRRWFDDAVGHALLKAVPYLDRRRGYVYAVMRNAALDVMRYEGYRNAGSLDAFNETLERNAVGAGMCAVQWHELDEGHNPYIAVDDADEIEALLDGERWFAVAVVVLTAEGYTAREISRLTGATVPCIKGILWRLRTRMQREMYPEPGVDRTGLPKELEVK